MSSRFRNWSRSPVLLGVLLASVTACSRQSGAPREEVAVSAENALAMTSELQAGGVRRVATRNPFEGDNQALADGERLYRWMNCAGCHGPAGGGGMGPPFRDRDWIYGDDPASIFESIGQGRPNGMPSFGLKLPEEHIWKIALFVRSLGEQPAEQGGQGGQAGPTESTRRRQPGGAAGQR
jgi:cytochrome c oxidase cbb3-type subunit 3